MCGFERNRTALKLSSARLSIGGAIAAARAVPCGFIGMIAGVIGVTVPGLHFAAALDTRIVIATPEIRQVTLTRLIGVTVPGLHFAAALDSHIVIATPKIRQAAFATNAHDIRIRR